MGATTMLKKKTLMKRKQNWKKSSTQSFKNSTNNTVEWEVKQEEMMTGMMMILQTTMNFKQTLGCEVFCQRDESNKHYRQKVFLWKGPSCGTLAPRQCQSGVSTTI